MAILDIPYESWSTKHTIKFGLLAVSLVLQVCLFLMNLSLHYCETLRYSLTFQIVNMTLLAILASRGRTTERKKKTTSQINTAIMVFSALITVLNVAITGLNTKSHLT